MIGKRYADILPELENQEIFNQLDSVFTTGFAFHAKNQRVDIVIERELKTFYFNYSFTPLYDAAGKVYGVMNTAADVTDLALAKREIEEKERILRSIILQAPVAISIHRGPQHRLEIANKDALAILGRQEEDLLNKPLFEAVPELEAQAIKGLFDTVYETGKIYAAAELPVQFMRNGAMATGYFAVSLEPLYDASGHIDGILTVGIEVTDQVLARQKIEEVVAQRTKELAETNNALSRTNEELKRSNTNLEEFAYAASHDLKEPVRKIHFFSDRIKSSLNQRMTAAEQQSFERLETAAKRMGSLIDDLLSYSQVSLRPQHFEEVDMKVLLDLVLTDLDLEIDQKRADIQVEKLCVLHGHQRQLQQAFQNLLSNALKYAAADRQPQIIISSHSAKGEDLPLKLSAGEAGKMFCVIAVKDNGIGFDQSDAERIFNVFTRLHGNIEYRGTGVGLSIVRKVVENHHGYVTAHSKPGEGSTFTVYLPV